MGNGELTQPTKKRVTIRQTSDSYRKEEARETNPSHARAGVIMLPSNKNLIPQIQLNGILCKSRRRRSKSSSQRISKTKKKRRKTTTLQLG